MELEDAAIAPRTGGLVAHVAVQRAHRPAMGDEQDPAVGVVAGDAFHGREYAPRVLVARLPVRALAAREALLDLGAGEARPGADVDLPQAGIRDDRDAVGRGDDLRRLVRALQVARVDRVEGHVSQLLGEVARLRTPGLVQRRVGPALPDPVAVPVGLAVPCEENGRHATATVAARWSSDSRARSASSPAPRRASGSSSRGS